MSAEVITITDRQQWLQERAKDVTSTEVSALFGLSPYKTEFELFHEKRDNAIVAIPENERMKWGNRLESIIAHSAAEDYGWEIAKLNVYMRKPEYRMGSSFDFEILSSSDGPGILEIKNVDGIQYAKNWIDDGQGNIEAPNHIEMQIQHQMEVADREWTALGEHTSRAFSCVPPDCRRGIASNHTTPPSSSISPSQTTIELSRQNAKFVASRRQNTAATGEPNRRAVSQVIIPRLNAPMLAERILPSSNVGRSDNKAIYNGWRFASSYSPRNI